jgi:AmmeMemoRadiSam system protein B
MSVRQPDFAGSWYPETERECKRSFAEFEARCGGPSGLGTLHGGIVPHAGWIFSGRLAYHVIRELARGGSDAIDTVILFGGHLRPGSPATLLADGGVWTPLGELVVDEELAGLLLEQGLELRREDPDRHAPDNTTELQLPILRHLLPAARILLLTPPPRENTIALADAVVEAGRSLGRRMLAIGSTDLSHYGPNYGWEPQGRGPQAIRWVREENDRRFIERALELDARGAIEEGLRSSNACCPGAAAAALRCGELLGAQGGTLLDYAQSADLQPGDSFVGYAGIVF